MKLPHWLRGRKAKRCSSTVLRRNNRRLGFESLEGRRLLTGLLVTTAADSVTGSLRAEIATANADSAAGQSDTITFAAALNGQTININPASGALELTAGAGLITINGGNQVTLSGQNQTQILVVDQGANASLTGLAFTAGSNASGSGGAIYTNGSLTITSSTFTSNAANPSNGNGGAIWNQGTLVVSNSTFSLNTTGEFGGAIETDTGSATITGSTFSGNSAQTGGALAGYGGTLTVSTSTISGNSATDGGGIYNNAALTVVNSTISGNTASSTSGYGELGGGIYNDFDGVATLSNSTISGNSAAALGGGLFNWGTDTLSNVTIAANSSDQFGGGIYQYSGFGATTIVNTIVAKNTATDGDPDIDGPIVSTSTSNLVGDGTGMTGIANGSGGNQVGTSGSPIDPLLGPLQNNGGTTQTMALGSGSPAINAGGAVTTLASSVSVTATTFATSTVTNYAAIASSPGTFVIQIDSEQILITGYNSSDSTVTVVRGYNGTTAAAHAAGAGVVLPYDQIGVARVGAPDLGASEYHASPIIITLGTTSAVYPAGSGPTLIAPTATASAGANGLASSKLTVQIGSAGGTDVVTVVAGGSLTITGNQLFLSGVWIANFAAGAGSSPLVVQFNGAATTATVQVVLQHVAFYNTNPSPALYNRTATFTLADSKGVASTPVTETIQVVDLPPAIGNLGPTVTYSAGSGATLVAAGATITPSSIGLASSKLTVQIGSSGSADVVTIVVGGGVTISGNTLSYNGTAIGTFTAGAGSSPLLVQFNAAATAAAVQAVIDHVAFYNTSSSPSVYDRTLTFTLVDSKGTSSTPTSETIHFVDNPPALGGIGSSVSYTAGSGATLVASSATVTVGSLGVADAKLTVSIGSSGGADVVTIVAGGGVTISGSTLSYNGTAIANFVAGAGSSPLVVQFFASATTAAVQAVIERVAFYNTNASPSIYDRSLAFTLADSKGVASSPVTETVHFVAAPPVIGNLGSTINYAPGSGPTTVASGATVTAGTNGLAGSKLTVSLGSAGSADMVTIVAGGGVTLSGSQVLYNGTVIGNFVAGSGSNPLIVQFNGAATAAAVQAVVDGVAYYNTNPSMSVYDRTISFTLADSKGNSAAAVSKTIHVT